MNVSRPAGGYPDIYRITQLFENTAVADVTEAVHAQFAGFNPKSRVKAGQRVAVAVGSRGIDRIDEIVAALVAELKSLGLVPFVIPAMGSHGKATAQGQKDLLAGLGVSEQRVGAPVVSNMETVSLGNLDSGAEVFVAADALDADHLFAVNRVKPHTVFRAEVESGLCKMLAVGCGKREGADSLHKAGLGENIVSAAQRISERVSVLGGLAVVENSLDKIYRIQLVAADEFAETDRRLLMEAKSLLPRIPVERLDILIVDEIGKNISGAGLDPNVIGFWRRDGGPRLPDYGILILLDLTSESHGNAIGVGMGDLITRRLADKIDYEATYTNVMTSGKWRSGATPMTLDSDRAAVELALSKMDDPENVRMARIRNTLHLETLWVSRSVLPELRQITGVKVDEQPRRLAFDTAGRIFSFSG